MSSFLNFYAGWFLFKSKNNISKRIILSVILLFNIGMLGIFKYADFAILIINDLSILTGHMLNLSLLHIMLPLAISFYTFEAISYILDIYYGRIRPEKSLLNFLLFLAFFPKLIAGPIMRASEFLPQLKRRKIIIKAENVKLGITIILFGLFKKIVIADNVAFFVDSIFSDPTSFHSSLPIILGAFVFGIQIYADFSGYCDIAIGAAKLFGFDLVQNFNKPYLSKNPSEFWRRWHISLSFWIRDYVYTPIYVAFSNNGRINRIKSIYLKTMLAIFIATIVAWLVMGLWHGAYWNFLIYGLYNGLLIIAYYLIIGLYKKLSFMRQVRFQKFREFVSIFVTFYLIMLGFMMFRITNLQKLYFSVRSYLGLDFINAAQDLGRLQEIIVLRPGIMIALILFVTIYLLYFFIPGFNIKDRLTRLSPIIWMLAMALILLVIIIMIPSKSGTFIYFQF
jgi:D-alanyl-lipoteichoic acid acyltransferase DltB (MBOAT superfamily)